MIVNEWVLKVNADLHLVDTSNFTFVLEPETQEWVASQIFPDLKIMKVRKLAFLVS